MEKDNTKDDISRELEEDIFEFLYELRLSGKTNMYGATPFIINEFDITKKEARTILQKWFLKIKRT